MEPLSLQFQPANSVVLRGPIDRAQAARDSFASVLSRSRQDPTQTPEQAARAGAEQFVAIALIQPILKELRESNAAAPPFAPSSGEKQFQSLFDGHVARQLASATRFPLVERIAADLLKHGRAPADAAGADGARLGTGRDERAEVRTRFRAADVPER